MRALLVIDVIDSYLNQHKHYGMEDDIPVFLQNIVYRVLNGNDALVLFFTDFSSAQFPSEFSYLLGCYGPAIYKTDFSAFDYDPPEESELAEVLREHGIEEIEVCGLYANWCIAATVQDALKLGYRVRLNPSIVLGEDGRIKPDLSQWEKDCIVV